MPYTKLRSLSQKVNLKEGQSLVVTGFDQNNTTTSKAVRLRQQIHYLVVHKPGKMNAARL
ncbi:hypothetical protein NBY16_23985 (plasmid) [Escherichia coli]|nr:hypothetical protein [Escherichia coli]URV04726.1 hypothetical protein NBY16_23985 [Escherichia coli]